MPTVERACGLCQTPITQEVLQSGGARAVRGTLCCAKCASVYDQALAETREWRTALAGGVKLSCGKCGVAVPLDDVREESVLRFQGQLACKRCAKDLRALLLPRKTSGRQPATGGVTFAKVRSEPETSGALGVVLALGAVVLLLAALGYALVHRGPAATTVPASVIAGEKAREAADRALALVTRPPDSYEAACAVLKEITDLSETHKGFPEAEGKFKTAIERATRSRDGFAPAIASKLMDEAAGELKKTDHPEEAVQVLGRFPKELEGTTAAAEIASARVRYEALATCRRAALQLLSLGGVEGFQDMDTLMGSPEAQECGFAKTDLGQKVDAERRRRRNASVVNAAAVPVAAGDLKAAAQSEFLFKLVEAEAQYANIARASPDRADAHLGLARIYLERDRLDLALPYAEQGVRLAPSRADAVQVQAWLEWLSTSKDFRDRAGRTLAPLKKEWFHRLGRRLSWLYDLGEPLHLGTRVRVFGRGVTAEATEATATDAEAAAATAAQALAVPEGTDRVDLILYANDAEKAKHIEHLEIRKLTHEGVLLGCFAVTPHARDSASVRLAVAAGIARRAPGAAPEWLVAALPYVISARPPAGTLKVKLADLERLDMTNVLTRADAWATSLELCSICYTEEGRQALAAYVSARKEGASPRAREALEQAYRRLAGR